MPIIVISRGCYHHGRAVAEKLAVKLGYRCLSRDQIIDGLDDFHLPEIKLVRCLNDTFSILDRFPNGKRRYAAAVRSALLQQLVTSDIVYHGLVGHHFVGDLSHILKVRVISDTAQRVDGEMVRENITAKEARYILKKDDEERRKWGMYLYGIDIASPDDYDLVVQIGKMTEDEAVDIIAATVRLPSFQETAASRARLADMALTARIENTLFDFPSAQVAASGSRARISIKVPEDQQPLIRSRIDEMLQPIGDLREYTLRFDPYY